MRRNRNLKNNRIVSIGLCMALCSLPRILFAATTTATQTANISVAAHIDLSISGPATLAMTSWNSSINNFNAAVDDGTTYDVHSNYKTGNSLVASITSVDATNLSTWGLRLNLKADPPTGTTPAYQPLTSGSGITLWSGVSKPNVNGKGLHYQLSPASASVIPDITNTTPITVTFTLTGT